MPDTLKSVLVVDDDPKVRLLLRRCLETDGYQVLEAENKQQVADTLSENVIDLITLDLNLGSENGLEVATEIRAASDVPIIIVTGKGDVIDKVVGLELGADDYIAKPFHVREVLARVRSVLRRSVGRIADAAQTGEHADRSAKATANHEIFGFDGWSADFSKYELVDPTGNSCELTTSDFKLLTVFLKSPKRVLSRDQIMDQVNGHDWTPYDRTIDNQIARLRKKIEVDPASPKIIKTVRGVGYIFASDVTVS